MTQTFNEQQFRQVFTVTSIIRTKLQPFFAKYKQQNMNWIIRSLEQLHRMFFDKKIDLNTRFNSIFGIKFLFDTGVVALVNLIQIYFLPQLLKIASYDISGPPDKRGISYFIQNGYERTEPEVQKCGYSYVKAASQFVFNAAKVKPDRIYQGQPYNQPSEYSLALKKLQNEGWKMYSTPAYYKQGTAQTIKTLFQKNLTQNSVQTYISYYNSIFQQIIEEEKPLQRRLDPKKMLESGDTYISAAVVRLCGQYLRTKNLKNNKNALSLLNYLIKWGDIEAAHLVNCTDVLNELLFEVANEESSSKMLSRGKSLFKQSKSSQQTKQQLYQQLMKCMEFWSLCYPQGIKIAGQPSKMKSVHDQLRSKLQLQFPINSNLKEDKSVFNQQIARNRLRNVLILQRLQETDPQPMSFVYPKSTEISNKKALPGTYQYILQQIKDVQKMLETICEHQGQADNNIPIILEFAATFESKIETAELTQQQFDQLLSRGDDLTKKISKVAENLKKYRQKKITFQQLRRNIQNVVFSFIKNKPALLNKDARQSEDVAPNKKTINQKDDFDMPDISDIRDLQSVILVDQQKLQPTPLIKQPAFSSASKNPPDFQEKQPVIPQNNIMPITRTYSVEQSFRQSVVSSRKTPKMQEKDSKISSQMNNQQEDLIMMPEDSPLQVSYHNNSLKQSLVRQSKTFSFKQCFKDDKYLFGLQRQNKKYRLVSQSLSLIRTSPHKKHNRSNDSSLSISDMLNQKNERYQQELRYVEVKKDKKIEHLNSMLKELESSGKKLAQNVQERQKEIVNFRTSTYCFSRVNKNSIVEDQDQIFKATFKSRCSKRKGFIGDSVKKEPRVLNPQGKMVAKSKYDHYFQQFQTDKLKKILLKNKELLLKTDDIEFGCMSKRDKKKLAITFYITPSSDLDNMAVDVIPTSNLEIQVQTKNIRGMRKGKQTKLTVTVSIIEIPYSLPTISFSYNLGSRLQTQKFLIPCSFHKFISLTPVSQLELSRKFQQTSKVLRGQEVPYSKRLLKKLDSLADYFPTGTLLNAGQPNDKGEVQYGGKSSWQGQQFWIRIMVKQSQLLYVQAVAEESVLAEQFYISLVTDLLMKKVDLKEM